MSIIYEAEGVLLNPEPMDEGLMFRVRFSARNRKQALRRLKRYFPSLLVLSLKAIKL